MTAGRPTTEERSFGGGCLLATALVIAVSVAAIPVASHWNSRGGEEWWTALVLGSAGAAFLRGLLALRVRPTRPWAAGLIGGAALGLAIVFGTFLVYFLGLHGS